MLLKIGDASASGAARRAVTEAAGHLQAGEDLVGRMAIVAVELSTNLVKHGGGGDLLIRTFSDGDGDGLELLALDKGRGMVDIHQCLQDGYSTAGSPGTGLGAVTRLADVWDVHSRPGAGTAVLARFRVGRGASKRPRVGAVCEPYPGETVTGDAWAWSDQSGITVLVVDGLGHGLSAADAAGKAVGAFQKSSVMDCVNTAKDIHRALLSTRGAAIAIARVGQPGGDVAYVGVGNISGSVYSGGKLRKMISHNGIAGHAQPRFASFSYSATAPALILMHSDGLSSRWDLASDPTLPSRHPALIAGVLYRDNRRLTDDNCVVVVEIP